MFSFKTAIAAIAHIDGEDERSVAKNVDIMLDEMKKSKPDIKLLTEKMKRTGTLRQKFCLEATTAETLTKFPALGLRAFVSIFE